jgi:hypothetical protein
MLRKCRTGVVTFVKNISGRAYTMASRKSRIPLLNVTRTPLAFTLAAALLATPASAFLINIDRNTYASEYANFTSGQYVLLVDGSEVADGRAGPGWYSTGQSFAVALPGDGGVPVCRFYAPAANTHFFTASPSECEALKAPGSGWLFEKIAFEAYVPSGGNCRGLSPVYRLYNNVPDRPIHRYVASAVTQRDLVAAGWIDEGIAFCSSVAQHVPERFVPTGTTMASSRAPIPEAACPASGTCVALDGLPAMTRELSPYVPPLYFDSNPQFPIEALALTGHLQNLHTAVTSPHPRDVVAHSYVGAGGIFINGADRQGGELASARALHRFSEAETLRPWVDAIPRELRLSYWFKVNHLETPAGSHAYGHPAMVFRDVVSGLRLDVTVQSFGTMPPGEFAGADGDTGRVLVSTALGAPGGFGKSLGGYVRIRPSDMGPPAYSVFRLHRGDFANALARARAIEPRLSADPADYRVEAFDFKVETYGDARVGVTFTTMNLEVLRD